MTLSDHLLYVIVVLEIFVFNVFGVSEKKNKNL